MEKQEARSLEVHRLEGLFDRSCEALGKRPIDLVRPREATASALEGSCKVDSASRREDPDPNGRAKSRSTLALRARLG